MSNWNYLFPFLYPVSDTIHTKYDFCFSSMLSKSKVTQLRINRCLELIHANWMTFSRNGTETNRYQLLNFGWSPSNTIIIEFLRLLFQFLHFWDRFCSDLFIFFMNSGEFRRFISSKIKSTKATQLVYNFTCS